MWIIKDYKILNELYSKRGSDFSGRPFEDLHYRFKIMNHEKDFGRSCNIFLTSLWIIVEAIVHYKDIYWCLQDLYSIGPLHVNPKFGNNFGNFLRHRNKNDVTSMDKGVYYLNKPFIEIHVCIRFEKKNNINYYKMLENVAKIRSQSRPKRENSYLKLFLAELKSALWSYWRLCVLLP